MSYIKINDILKKRGKKPVKIVPAAAEGARIKVLIGGCEHCARLRDNTLEAMRLEGMDESELETVTDLAKIIRMGVMATPALIVDGMLISAGKVLSVDEVQRAITRSNAD